MRKTGKPLSPECLASFNARKRKQCIKHEKTRKGRETVGRRRDDLGRHQQLAHSLVRKSDDAYIAEGRLFIAVCKQNGRADSLILNSQHVGRHSSRPKGVGCRDCERVGSTVRAGASRQLCSAAAVEHRHPKGMPRKRRHGRLLLLGIRGAHVSTSS